MIRRDVPMSVRRLIVEVDAGGSQRPASSAASTGFAPGSSMTYAAVTHARATSALESRLEPRRRVANRISDEIEDRDRRAPQGTRRGRFGCRCRHHRAASPAPSCGGGSLGSDDLAGAHRPEGSSSPSRRKHPIMLSHASSRRTGQRMLADSMTRRGRSPTAPRCRSSTSSTIQPSGGRLRRCASCTTAGG